jgi:hypothetical protein
MQPSRWSWTGNLIASRIPDDIPQFSTAFAEA